MACGTALMFGIVLPINFRSPLKANSLIDYWSRWHITLTRTITEYIYTPFVRYLLRPTTSSLLIAIVVSMTIAGVWHGAGWTFVLFGFLHGIGLTINHLWRRTGRKIPTLISWFLTINFVNICLVFFSASSIEQSYVIISRMFFDIRIGSTSLFQDYMAADIIKIGIILVIATCVTFFSPNAQEILDRFKLTKSRIIYTSVLIVVSLLFMNTIAPKEFIYFAF